MEPFLKNNGEVLFEIQVSVYNCSLKAEICPTAQMAERIERLPRAVDTGLILIWVKSNDFKIAIHSFPA